MIELANEKSYCERLKGESIAKIRFKYFFLSTNIYIIIYPTLITLPRSRCVFGVINGKGYIGGLLPTRLCVGCEGIIVVISLNASSL